jgi:hypothetical protein
VPVNEQVLPCDTGATFSLLPHKSHHPPVQRPRLIGPNGQPICCWGKERLRLQFGGRTFWWLFLKADVTFPILGVDFLRNNRLSVSVATNQLVDDANGDLFRLTEQPSGHTASVMLPANMREESGMPARPTAPFPGKGPRATYATAVTRSSPLPAAAEGDATAAIQRGDFTFTRRPPPKAASTPPQQPPLLPQPDCPSISAVGDSNLTLQLVPFGPHRVLCNVSRCHSRPFIPLSHHRQVFNAFHSQAHRGTRARKRLMQDRVVWTCMNITSQPGWQTARSAPALR